MIHLIHGPDITSSRNLLAKIRNNASQVLVLDARSEKKTDLKQKLSQTSFLSDNLVILDWFEEKTLPRELKVEKELVVWTAQTLVDTSFAGKVSFFPVKSVSIFKLTDAFGFRKVSLTQEYLDRVLFEKEPPEVVVSLLLRQIKLISFALSGDKQKISKSNFVQEKIADQSRLWSEKTLRRAIRALLEADLAVKSGLNPKVVLSLALSKALP